MKTLTLDLEASANFHEWLGEKRIAPVRLRGMNVKMTASPPFFVDIKRQS
jgi:hypothetical protein